MRHKLSNLFFGLGLFFLISGLLFYLVFWFSVIGMASVLIGIILVLLSTKNWKAKFLSIGIPVAIGAFFTYRSYITPATYLIPEGYRGNVMVVFNQKNGRDEEYEGRRRIYRIPLSGVLFTKFKDEEGFINEEYFYVSRSGHRTKLGVLDTRDFNEEWTLQKNPHEPPRDSLAVFNPGTMGILGNSSDSNHKVFIELSVRTYNDKGPNFREFTPEYIDSLKLATKKNGY
jgi:uncharacterized protein DUF6843